MAHHLFQQNFHRLYCVKYHRREAWLQGPAKVERPWSQDPELADAWNRGMTCTVTCGKAIAYFYANVCE